MKCENYLVLIDDLVEGELDGRFTEQVNSHLFACRECAAKQAILRAEKELYSHYLFDVEPPNDLAAKFRSKLKAEKEENSKPAVMPAGTFDWGSKIANCFRLYPSAAAVAGGLLVLLAINFAFFRLVADHEQKADLSAAGKKELSAAESSTNAAEINENKPAALAAGREKADDFLPSKINDKAKSSALIKTLSHTGKAGVVKGIKVTAQTAADKKNVFTGKAPFSEERLHRSKLKNLESETAKQVEKIELLLRSFRNARAVEDGETFDVAYEKQQARKLLERNVRLRQSAENYGTFYMEELLSRAEPVLLEIANLENTPSSQKVQDIKERLRNQNLIASLQAY